jgi:glycosyltransferase involved in cell wall biosynthesis
VTQVLNIFYEEPIGDRWLPGDRLPRAVVRRFVRGKPQPSGHRRVFINLCEGLKRLGIPYRVNDYGFARKNPDALACIVGKPAVLDKMGWRNPILFGASIYSHPIDDPNVLSRFPIKKVLVPGLWMKDMFARSWGDVVESWPVGIATDLWKPSPVSEKKFDVLLYDKVRWRRDHFQERLIEPIRELLRVRGVSFVELRYGSYREEEFHKLLGASRSMIFLCEHETQGIAYQQALSCGVPIFAWDVQGPWTDPTYYPHRVVYESVTSVPYWDERCGLKFRDAKDFEAGWGTFWEGVAADRFNPRNYVLDNLTLERCSSAYARIAQSLS